LSKKLKVEGSTRKVEPKRRPSRWEREKKRRRILEVIIVVAIIGVVASGIVVAYGHYIKPWHQPIVRVNDKVFDMDYFVKMLRLYGAGQNPYQDVELARQVATELIPRYELRRQAAEKFDIEVSEDEIEEQVRSYFGFDPANESEKDFDQRVEEALKESGLSIVDFEQMFIEPMLLETKLREYIGNREYPEDEEYEHVQVQAMLLGTEEEALEVRSKWEDTGFDHLINATASSRYYPDDSLEWLPQGIESSAFDDFAFGEGSENIDISAPIFDTTYYTKGGYWLVMVLEERGEGDEKELHIQGILLDSNTKANEARDRIEAGEDFAEIAEEYSLHSGSKDNGGDMGWLSLEDVKSRFGADILDLELNSLSEPISQVYWLVKVLEERGEGDEAELHIQGILLDSNVKTSEAKDRIEAGEEFAEIAEEYSLHADSKDNGGDMGWLSLEDVESRFGASNLDGILDLELNSLSEPISPIIISKQSGYWLIEVLNKEDRTLSEEHRDILTSKAFNDWFEEEKKKAEEEGRIKSYLDNDKILWALEHI